MSGPTERQRRNHRARSKSGAPTLHPKSDHAHHHGDEHKHHHGHHRHRVRAGHHRHRNSPPPPVSRRAVLHCPGVGTLTLPWWPDDIADAKRAAAWSQIERPGRAPLLEYAGDVLAERAISYTARNVDFDESIEAHLQSISAIATSRTPVTLMLGHALTGPWHVTDLSWTVTNTGDFGHIAGADVSFTLTAASDASIKVGPVPPRRAQARAKRLRKKTKKTKTDDDDSHGAPDARTGLTRPSMRGAPHNHKSPEYARWFAKQYMQQKYGWGQAEYDALVKLWTRESGWNYAIVNHGSGATGIPQALPGSKMASAGADWRTNPETQIKWGLSYIKGRYTTPRGAWAHSERTNWY